MNTMPQKLHFNILPFDWPKEEVTMYFSKDYQPFSSPVHKSIFPNDIEKIFPKLGDKEFIYTSYVQNRKGFTPLQIDLKNENPHFVKRFFDNRIRYYFRRIQGQITHTGFIKETQVLVHAPELSNDQVNAYDRFSVKVQLQKVSAYPEIVLSYNGITHVAKRNLTEITDSKNAKWLNKIILNNRILRYADFVERHLDDYRIAFPIINHQLGKALKYELPFREEENPYKDYKARIEAFYERFLNNDNFRKFIPLHKEGFLHVPTPLADRTREESSELVFGKNGISVSPQEGLRKFGPFRPGKSNKVKLFYIFHKDDLNVAMQLDDYFHKGIKSFKGLQEFAHVITYRDPGFSIMFHSRMEPVHEIELALYSRLFEPDVQYLAIYLTPIGRFEKEKDLRNKYFEVKELLLKRGIVSQVVDPVSVKERGEEYAFSLPNMAVNILAKLGGVPWSLRSSDKKELVVGVGAFKSRSTGVQYIGSAFCFDNTGKFNRFDCFLKNELDMLVGSIIHAVRNYVKVNNKIERLIIHFYKKMSFRELQPIEEALKNMGLSIPVFIVSINKTESRDIVAFDEYDPDLMPLSGTYLSIDTNRFILFNNTRYAADPLSVVESYPFPVKLAIDCSDKKQLENYQTIRDLINQVYQFSRLYWKSIKQQNLPITIKYPEILAKMAPNFREEELPMYGKKGLWFL